MNGRERVLAHLAGEPVDHLPVMPITMQFAADLIEVTYLEYETDYRVLAEGQMRVAEEFGLDYVNTMSDPAREAADCGAAVEFFPNSPAAIIEEQAILADKQSLLTLMMPTPETGPRMLNGVRAIERLKEQVGGEKIVEGWIEGPCAEAADLRGINTLMLDFYDDPHFVRDLFEWVVQMELGFARAQVRAGADIIGIGDAAASLVGPQIYEEFVWPFEKQLIDGVHAMGARARLHICGNTRFALRKMGLLQAEILDLDFPAPLGEAREKLGNEQVLLGNLNPVTIVRNGTRDQVLAGVEQCHRQAGSRYIVGAGCEIPRDTPPENVRALSDYACAHAP